MSFPRSSFTAALLLLLAFTSVSVKAQSSQDSYGISDAEQELFTRGQTLYVDGLYGEAIGTLDEFLTKYPSSTIKDLALLWLGRSYLAQGDIAKAEKVEVRLKDVPDSPLLGIYEEELRAGRQSFARANTGLPAVTQAEVLKPIPSERAPVAKAPEQPALKEPAESSPAPEQTIKTAVKPAVPPVAASQPVVPAQVVQTPPAVSPVAPTQPALKLPSATIPTPEPTIKPAVKPALAAVATSHSVVLAQVVQTPAAVSPKLPAAAVPTVVPRGNSVIKPAASAVVAAQPVKRTQLTETSSLQSKLEEEKNGSGDLAYRLLLVNDGGARAADLTIRIELQPALAYLNSDLMPIRQELIGGRSILTFKIPAVEAGQTRSIQISTHARAQGNVVAKPTYSVFYKDNLGQFHHTPQ